MPKLPPHELARLLELSSEINDLLDLDLLLAQVVSAGCELLETEMSTVLILDDPGSRLDVVAAAGLDADLARGLSTPVGQNLAGMVALSGKPVRCCDVPGDSRSQLPAVQEARISSAMLVPMAHRGEVIGVLGVESRERRRFSAREQNLLQVLANQAASAIEKVNLYETEHRHVVELRDLVGRVNSQNTVMTRSRDAHERLTQVALEGLGVDALTRTTAELVGAPLALANKFGCLMHAAAPSGDDAIRLWEECAGNPRFGRQLERLRERAGMGEPEFVGEAGFWRIVPAVAAGEVLGFIIALDHAGLGEVEIIVLEQASTIVAAELLRERSIADAEARLHGDLLRSLLLGDRRGPELNERAALLGHDLAAAQCVVMLRTGEDAGPLEPGVATSAGGWAGARVGLRAMLASVDDGTAALLSAKDRDLSREAIDGWIEGLAERLASVGVDASLRIGVSPIGDPPDLRESLHCAKQALAVSDLRDVAGVTHFEDVELLAMLISAADREPLRRFVRGCVGELQAYDERRGSSLAQTLEVYLDHSGVARHAAKALFLHPHSLRYRLRRISEIQGLDMSDPMARLMAHLALKLRSAV